MPMHNNLREVIGQVHMMDLLYVISKEFSFLIIKVTNGQRSEDQKNRTTMDHQIIPPSDYKLIATREIES